MKKSEFMIHIEKLVDPINVGTLHFMQSFNNKIPKHLQKKMVDSSGKKTPYMGFVVEPYSYFLCYELNDLKAAKSFLPEGYSLAKTKIFEDDEPKYYGIFGCFNAHTSGFWGLRVEFYIIAIDDTTGLLSWIIIDYDTNTITYDPKNGLSDPNAAGSVMTVDYSGTLYTRVTNEQGRSLAFDSDITQGTMHPLDNRLWVEGNLSIAYGKNRSENHPGLFSLIFDPKEFQQALLIPSEALTLIENNWFPGLFKDTPQQALCFPYAQHFLSDSPGHSSLIANENELKQKVENIDFTEIKVFSTRSFKYMFLAGGLMSLVINTLLVTLLILK